MRARIGQFILLFLLLPLLLGVGPRRTPEAPPAGDALAAHAPDILEGIMKGISEGDYELYARDFSDILRKDVSREDFLLLQRKIQKRLGKMKRFDLLGHYVQQGEVIVLFKARFAKDKDDVLIKTVLDAKQSIPVVTGLWFDCPALAR
jgi:hypothetical protein